MKKILSLFYFMLYLLFLSMCKSPLQFKPMYRKTIMLVVGAIRNNKVAETATYVEIIVIFTNWFKFIKDRD